MPFALCEQMLGPEHPDEIVDRVRSPVRNVRNEREHHERALSIAQDKTAAHELFARAIAVCEHSFGMAHPYFAKCLEGFGKYLHDSGESDDTAAARSYYERALNIFTGVLGSMHPDSAQNMISFADYLRSTGNEADRQVAQSLLEQAIRIFQATLGECHHLTVHSLDCLAKLDRAA